MRKHARGMITEVKGGWPDEPTSCLPITMHCLEISLPSAAAIVIEILFALKLHNNPLIAGNAVARVPVFGGLRPMVNEEEARNANSRKNTTPIAGGVYTPFLWAKETVRGRREWPKETWYLDLLRSSYGVRIYFAQCYHQRNTISTRRKDYCLWNHT